MSSDQEEEFPVIEEKLEHSLKLSAKYRGEVTWNGYGSDVMKSALQKYIRRGMLDKALYAAGELDLFKEAKEDRAESIRSNFIHRLMIIYMEDVENTALIDELDTLFTNVLAERLKESRNKEKEERWISRIVYLLTLSPKARVCSHIRSIFSGKYLSLLSKYPSLLELWPQIQGEDKYKLLSKFLKEKNVLAVYYAFQIDISNEKIGTRKAIWFIFDQLALYYPKTELFRRWYKQELSTVKEGFLCWLFPMLIYLGVIHKGEPLPDKSFTQTWDRNRQGDTIEVEDFVLDRHTRKGASKGVVEFAEIGAYVENEATFVNPVWKQFYEDTKRVEERLPIRGESSVVAPVVSSVVSSVVAPVESEEKAYEFVIRTQLVTSNSKQDVYFAKDSTGKLLIVKGPFPNESSIKVLSRNLEWKKRNGLPYLPFIARQMVPDRWQEGTPLGIRNNMRRDKPSWFAIFDSLVKEEQLKEKIHQSVRWSATRVVDWDKVSLHIDHEQLTKQEMIDYVHALLFRYVRGVSDLADRNFLKADGRVISIDEDIEKKSVDLYVELRKNKASFIYKWLEKHYEELEIEKWVVTAPEEVQRLTIVQKKESCLRLFKGN
jgi:hypothetical protein